MGDNMSLKSPVDLLQYPDPDPYFGPVVDPIPSKLLS